MNATATLEVGSYVLYRKNHGSRPVKTTVRKVSKAGWISISLDNGTPERPTANFLQFKPSRYPSSYIGATHEIIGTFKDGQLAAWSEGLEARWNADADALESACKDRDADKARRQAERDARHAAETAEVLANMGGSVQAAVCYRDLLPDGSRLVMLVLPVKAETAERKGGFERVLVRMTTQVESYSFDAGRPVEMAYTYVNGSTHSFASCSTQRFATDDAALTEAARSVYHNW